MSDIRGKSITSGQLVDVAVDNDGRVLVTASGNLRFFRTTTATALSLKTDTRGTDAGRSKRLLRYEVTFSTAPTTSENLTLTKNGQAAGDDPSAVLSSTDPSATAVTSAVEVWEGGYSLAAQDEVTLAYTNTDTRTIKAEIVMEVL